MLLAARPLAFFFGSHAVNPHSTNCSWLNVGGDATHLRMSVTWRRNFANVTDGLAICRRLSVNLSIDQARALLRFFCHLELSASQADLLLNHLAKLWKGEFDALKDGRLSDAGRRVEWGITLCHVVEQYPPQVKVKTARIPYATWTEHPHSPTAFR